jgi:hypothetical protein
MFVFRRLFAIFSVSCCLYVVSVTGNVINSGLAPQFNRDIRPILSDNCYTCHGPSSLTRMAGLRLDVEEVAKGKLPSGHIAIVPGDPNHSELYLRISSPNKARRMPPVYSGHDALPAHDVELIREWIAAGAKWQKHWALIPPTRAPLPEGADPRLAPIDAFVRAHLAEIGLKPSPEADRLTLLRRVSLDLTGLPPTPAQERAFLADTAPDAYERQVDRLLASPRYAERMAYRWMEAARYADTNGYQSDGNRQMWRWRDWVIDAFNRNMPFNEFTIDQLAGDLLPHPTLDQIIATGFLRNHRTNAEGGIVPEEFRVEYVADRSETTSTVWLGLTVGCARCHDHKYDPIPQRDYYRMFAFFNNVPEKGLVYNWGNDEPMIKAPTPDEQKRLAALTADRDARQKAWDALEPKIARAEQRWTKHEAHWGRKDWTVTDGLLVHETPAESFDGKNFVTSPGTEGKTSRVKLDYLSPFTFTARIKPETLNGAIVSKADDYFEGQGHALYLLNGHLRLHIIYRWTDIGMRVESEETLPLNVWRHVAVTYDGSRYAKGVHMWVDGRELKTKILFDELNWPMDIQKPVRIGAGGGLRFKGGISDARIYNRALTEDEVEALATDATVRQAARTAPEARTKQENAKLHLCFLATGAPRDVKDARTALAEAVKARDAYEATIPTVMVMKEVPGLRKTYILKRGVYDAHGDEVTAGTLSALPPMPKGAPANRLGLAEWIVDRGNPLTARVTVNRFWQMFFGTGLVKTVEDFGVQGERPEYQDVLDWLAVEFMDSGWDVKHVVKTIVMSRTYRQSSRVTPELEQRDPENRLLARGPRVRLPAEMIRDQALFVAGLLVEKMGGPSVKPYQPAGLWTELGGGGGYHADHGEGLYRRTLYTFWKRTSPPPDMINFDSPTRETCIVRETRTNTPLQSLTLMNDVAYLEAARKLAEKMMLEGGASASSRIEYGWWRTLDRAPEPGEERALLKMLDHFEKRYQADPKAADQYLKQGESPRDASLNSAELASYTAVASAMLNLDETITKE